MKAHEYWSVGALITMLGTFYSGYKGSKSSHKYFAASSLLCMIMAIYTGHRIISKNKKTEKESNSIENEDAINSNMLFVGNSLFLSKQATSNSTYFHYR